jgi:hypothetical protein
LACKPQIDPDLKLVVGAWPKLPEAIRRAILAMVDAAGRLTSFR